MHGWDHLQGNGPGWQGHHLTQAQRAEAKGCQGEGREPASSRKYEEAGQHQDYFTFISILALQVWNEELEIIAQRWTDQCVFDHDELRSKLDGSSAGQNAYLGKSSPEKTKEQVMSGLRAVVDAWYDEVTDPGFSSDHIDPFV